MPQEISPLNIIILAILIYLLYKDLSGTKHRIEKFDAQDSGMVLTTNDVTFNKPVIFKSTTSGFNIISDLTNNGITISKDDVIFNKPVNFKGQVTGIQTTSANTYDNKLLFNNTLTLLGSNSIDGVDNTRLIISNKTRPIHGGGIEYIATDGASGEHTFYTLGIKKSMVIAKTGNCFFMNNKEGAVLNGWDEHHSIWMRKGYDNASDVFDIRSYGRIRFFTGGLLNEQKERLSILNNGFVGIGTSVPTNILTIENNNNNPSIQLNGASPGWGSGIVLNNTLAKSHGIYSGADGSLHIASSGKDNLVIKDNGDVHIMGNLLKNGAQVDSIAKFSIIMWYGDTVPNGWAECNGQNGTPDLRGRFPLGEGQGANLTNRPNKSIGGAETHTLTIAEMPKHHHNFYYPKGNEPWSNGDGNAWWGREHNTPKDTNQVGDSKPHNNMPPFFVLKFIMKL
jgi:hypothetical protein